MRKLLCVLPLLLGGVLNVGCGIDGLHSARPMTRGSFDPLTGRVVIEDSKDNDISIRGVAVEGKGKVDEIIIRNNASDVRNANVNQMAGMAAQATANWQGAVAFAEQLKEILAEVMPYVPQAIAARALGKIRGPTSFSTPWGGGQFGGADASVIDGLLDIAGTARAPQSQPARVEDEQ